jgi:two-component system NtrC family sensor kinase
MSADRLIQRYRLLLAVIAAPMFILLLGLSVWQGLQARREASAELERSAAQHFAALQSLATVAVEHVADMRAQATRDILTQARMPDAGLRAALAEHLTLGVHDGYTLDNLSALVQPVTAQLLWPQPYVAPDDATLWSLQSLSWQAEVAHVRNAELLWSYYFGWPQQLLMLFPWTRSDELVDGKTGTMPALLEQWYQQEVVAAGLPQNNTARLAYWTAPHRDSDTREWAVSHAAPVYWAEDFRGIVGTDIRLSTIAARLSGLPLAQGRWWVITDRDEVLAESPVRSAAGQSIDGTDNAAEQPVAQASRRLPAGINRESLMPALLREGRAMSMAGYQVVALRAESAPWTLVLALSEQSLLLSTLPGLLPFGLVALALLAMFLYGQSVLRRRLVEPALGVMGYLHARSLDPQAPAPRLSDRWQPWIDVVTETFRAEREARARERESEAFKSAIVDNALAAIVSSDADGRIVEFNPAAEKLFGRTRAEVLGRLVADVIVPERFRGSHDLGMLRMRDGGVPRLLGRRVEMEAVRADGTEFPVDMVLWRTEVDGVAHYTASLNDLSERRDAAAQIERQREALRQSEKLTAMGSLLAGVAHELNNPLAIVMGRANLLEEKCEPWPELESDARRIRQAAERCGRIVRTFLNMARSAPPRRSEVLLNDLVVAAADMLSYTYRTHGIEIVQALDPHLPLTNADGDQIGQVVLNLLVNAQQALAVAPAPRTVTLSTGLDISGNGVEPRVWLRVADNGTGVPQDVREKIFEPFFTTKPAGIGTGLGLAVSRSLAREHGGDLTIESPASGGATFMLSLPLSGHAAQPAAAPGAIEHAHGEAPAQARVLVVDDEADIVDLMREMLESAGYEVATAESAAVALELLEAARFDAIVSDLRMPEMDGPALWREVSVRHPALAQRMLFVTGDTLSPGARQFLADANCVSLDKPFQKGELLAAVARLLE